MADSALFTLRIEGMLVLCHSQDVRGDASYLEELCHGDGPFAMLKAYFDESGIHGGSPICVVAGLVLPAKAAWSLSTEWQDSVLYKFKVPYFHAKEFAQRTGTFRGWSDDALHDFSIESIAVIDHTCNYYGGIFIAAALTSDDFFRLPTDERRWLTGGCYVPSANSGKKWKKQGAPSKPYFLLFQQAVLDAVKFSQDRNFHGEPLGTGDPVHFIFDQQTEYERTARAVFQAMKRMPLSIKDRIGDVVFSSKRRAIPLQVADFIAYESFCYLSRREVDGHEELPERAVRLLHQGFGRDARYVFMNAQILAKLLETCPMQPNKFFTVPDPQWRVPQHPNSRPYPR